MLGAIWLSFLAIVLNFDCKLESPEVLKLLAPDFTCKDSEVIGLERGLGITISKVLQVTPVCSQSTEILHIFKTAISPGTLYAFELKTQSTIYVVV